MNREIIYLIFFTVLAAYAYSASFFSKTDPKKYLLESTGDLEKRIDRLKRGIKIYYFVVPLSGFIAWDNYFRDHSSAMFVIFVLFGVLLNHTHRNIEFMKAILTLKKQSGLETK